MRHNLTWQDRVVFSLATRQPLWVWNAPGIGFSPLGQLGVPVPKGTNAVPRHMPGARLGAMHWGGAGGSGYMLTLGYTWSIGRWMSLMSLGQWQDMTGILTATEKLQSEGRNVIWMWYVYVWFIYVHIFSWGHMQGKTGHLYKCRNEIL